MFLNYFICSSTYFKCYCIEYIRLIHFDWFQIKKRKLIVTISSKIESVLIKAKNLTLKLYKKNKSNSFMALVKSVKLIKNLSNIFY